MAPLALVSLLVTMASVAHAAPPGRVMAWGENAEWALGDGSWDGIQDARTVPVEVEGLTDAVQVATGAWHSLAIRPDGSVWAWGNNREGQLGDGSHTHRPTPVQVVGVTNAIAVAGGAWHSLTLLANGTVLAWGDNNGGQLGDGTIESRTTPGMVPGLANVVAITAGGDQSYALLANGTVWTWGPGSIFGEGGGQLVAMTFGEEGCVEYSQGSPEGGPCVDRRRGSLPKPVDGLANVTAMSGGTYYSLFSLRNGTVMMDGGGPPALTGQDLSGVVAIPGLNNVTQVSTSGKHSLALLQDGTVMAWGVNQHGQVGDGTTEDRPTPVRVSGLAGVEAVEAGDMHSLALLADGTVKSWGLQTDEGGNAAANRQVDPLTMCGLPPTAQLAASQHTLAIVKDGSTIEGCGGFPWTPLLVGLVLVAALAGLVVALRAARGRPWLMGRIAWGISAGALVLVGGVWFFLPQWETGYLFGQGATLPVFDSLVAVAAPHAFGLAWLLFDVGLAWGLWQLRRPRGEGGRWPLWSGIVLAFAICALSVMMAFFLFADRPRTLQRWDLFYFEHGSLASLLGQMRMMLGLVLFVAAFGVRESSRITALGLGLLGLGLLAMSFYVSPAGGESATIGVMGLLAAAVGSGLIAWRGNGMARSSSPSSSGPPATANPP
jgi:alpha-tubulin suppressor-like RCC1 family protein